MKKTLILAQTITVIMSALGLYQIKPKSLTKSFWKPNKLSGRAYILDSRFPKPSIQIKNNQKYMKNNDEAIVFWVGGPKLGKNWDKDIKDFAFMFGKSDDSKDLAKNKVKGNYNISFDVYAGVQTNWEGIKSNEYFKEQFRASNTSGFVNANSQRPLTIGDVKYLKTAPTIQQIADTSFKQMIEDTTLNMYLLAKDLKAMGYKKVHYLSHSYGTFMTFSYIDRYKDEAFKYVDSIQAVATRLRANPEMASKIDGTFFPYLGYDQKSKKYQKVVKAPISQNAITSRIAMPIFYATSKLDFTKPLIALDDKNKTKVKILATDFDFRVGSMQPYELAIRKQGIDIKIVPWQTIKNYSETYLLQKKHKFPTKPKTTLFGKGYNHHDFLLRWYLDNALSKTKGSNWLSKEPLLISNETYWCSLKPYSTNKQLDDICVEK